MLPEIWSTEKGEYIISSLVQNKHTFTSVMVILQTETKFNLIFEINELFVGFPGESAGKESTCNVGNLGLNPGLGRAPGEGNGYPLQYSGLENSQSMESQRVGHDWVTLTFIFFMSIIAYFLN